MKHSTREKAVVEEFKDRQETLALFKILVLGDRQIEAGKTVPAKEAIRRLRGKAARRINL